VLWPAALVGLLAIMNRRRAAIVIAVAAIASAVLSSMLDTGGESYLRVANGLDTRGGALLIGCAAALLTVEKVFPTGRRAETMYRAACAVVAAGAIVLFGRGAFDLESGPRWLFFTAAVAATIVIVCVIHDPAGPPARILSWRPLTAVGTVSYGLYLWHYPIALMISGDVISSPTLGLVVRAVAIAAATIASYVLVERPFLRLKDRFRSEAQPS